MFKLFRFFILCNFVFLFYLNEQKKEKKERNETEIVKETTLYFGSLKISVKRTNFLLLFFCILDKRSNKQNYKVFSISIFHFFSFLKQIA